MGLLSLLGWGRHPDPEARAYLRDPSSNPRAQAGLPLPRRQNLPELNLATLPVVRAPTAQYRPRLGGELPPFPEHTLAFEARNERLPDRVRPNHLSVFPDAMSYALAGQRPPHSLPAIMRDFEPPPAGEPWRQQQQEDVPAAVSRNALPVGAPALNRGLNPAAVYPEAKEKALQERADEAAWAAALDRARAQIALETREEASRIPRPGRPAIAQLFPRSTRNTPSR